MAAQQYLQNFPGGYEVGQPAPPANVLTADSLLRKIKGPAPKFDLEDYILQTIQRGGQGATAEDIANLQRLNKEASSGPIPEEVDAKKADIEATGAMDLYRTLRGIPKASAPTMVAPRTTPLTLPEIPRHTAPQPNGVAQLLSGLFGVASPKDAGQFGAAALHGAIQQHQIDEQAKQVAYQEELQQRTALHADEQRRADVQAEIENENRRLRYDSDVRGRTDEMKMAVEGEKVSRLRGVADYLKGLLPGFRKAAEAQAGAAALRENIKLREGQQKDVNPLIRILELRDANKQREADKEAVRIETAKQHGLSNEIRRDFNRAMTGKSGFMMGPGGVVTPLPESQLSPAQRADIEAKRASAASARATAKAKNTKSAGAGTGNLEYRVHHNNALAAYNELKALDALKPGGSGSSDPDVKARIKSLWDTYYREKKLADAVVPKAKKGAPGVSTPGGNTFKVLD